MDNEKYNTENVTRTFNNLIKYLTAITMLESYKKSHDEYKEVLSIVYKWSVDYEQKRNLSLIHHLELLNIYNKLDELKGKWLFEPNMGEESELSDTVIIWLGIIMDLRKVQIQHHKE